VLREIQTPNPQIRSLGRTIEIIEVCYRKKAAPRRNLRLSAVSEVLRYHKIGVFLTIAGLRRG
jgi:hypothetical protein